MSQSQRNGRIKLLGPKVALGITTGVTLGAIIYSHYSQVRDKKAMKEGVERDKERIKIKKMLKKQRKQQQQQQEPTNV